MSRQLLPSHGAITRAARCGGEPLNSAVLPPALL
jgi:hypothetical protein